MTARKKHRPRILLVTSTGFPPERIEEIRDSIPEAELVTAEDDVVSVRREIPGVDGLVGCPRPIFSEDLLRRAGQDLQWIHVSGAGCEEFLIPALVDSDIVLTNGRIIQAPEVADHAMALLLSLTRNLNRVLRGAPRDSMPRPVELRGKTALIIGLGGIGMLVAERAAAFGMTVLAVNPDCAPMLSMIERVYPPERLAEALKEADVVMMTAPHTWATEGMMDREAFACMKPSAYFINVSRGKTVQTRALTEAVQAGRLRGVGLDVTEPEPLPDDHPLRRLPNVVITPHIAGLSEHNRERSLELIKANIERFVRGLPLYNVVRKNLGY